ncbi:MAG: 3-hydroxyacyl-[acyl-carrier-protein] dehydratase FabZ [Gammaproteobacteria bacterium]|nr:MAG: 3-hydroxyacyl-[acyl-carrier-protein] dehydratase FabZ [Gammaproteobacteria bacterium]RLA22495.1 MAG: 3-hydroxyacyl-[acyl-carrier-protein] dehydratase FabZ [Gammaproteobacteria bacterium]
MDIEEIQEYLIHRFPFLLVDRVVEFEKNERLVALKNVTYNEPFFQGHFPGQSIMPGVLIIEALAQATGLLAMKSEPEKTGKGNTYYLVGINKARFRKPVTPGDQLMLEAIKIKERRNIWSFACTARVDDKVVATVEIMCASPGEGV